MGDLMMINRHILLCVTGGIAVYKAAALTSKLTQSGSLVKVVMTESARQFVSPLTFQALSKHDVYYDTFDEKDSSVIAHIDLADWADLVIVAPATANVIGKLANGISDDMITTTLLATTSEVWIAPAMNVHMYENAAVKRNIRVLDEDGYRFIEPDEGYLACGYVGKGRLEEPEKIVKLVASHFDTTPKLLKGKKLLLSAGPTNEAIDPVRYLTNQSSGKMGYAIAEVAAKMGAEVTLVSGPVNLEKPDGVQVIPVVTAQEMYDEIIKRMDQFDIIIKSAAVSDYKPKEYSAKKMKKTDENMIIELERTKDILMTVGERKTDQIVVGFAAETNNVDQYAEGKLKKKKANMIVANNVTEKGAGFGSETNIVTFYKEDGTHKALPILSKREVARELLTEIKGMIRS
jgi:phosphopantothenoylcysteine decarboxylase/phosphopantothenate--cysteine ligase